MTNPNTLGLFEEQIAEIAAVVHAAGGLMYYDGANANALMGNARPATWASTHAPQLAQDVFDSHGGGGAGHGPLGVAAHLVEYLPTPVVVRDGAALRLEFDRPRSIGHHAVSSGRTSLTPCARWPISTPTAKKV